MEQKRLTHDEYDAMVALKSAQAVFKKSRVWDDLQERLRGTRYGARDKGLVLSALNRLLESLYDTIPEKQLDNLFHNLSVSGLYVGVRVTDKSMSDYGQVLSFNQINALHSAAKEKCLLCTLNPQEQRQCPLAKIFDELPGKKDEHSRGCGYFGF